jgi:hypothetical protein
MQQTMVGLLARAQHALGTASLTSLKRTGEREGKE